jgi:hypothetical protein
MAATVITPIENDQQWKALRKQCVGASESPALLGAHDYLTYYGLWARKAGRLSQTGEDTGAMERGRRLEPVAVDIIRDRYPQWNITVPHEHYADQQFGIGATPDLLAHDEEHGSGVIQIKSVAPQIFRRHWRGDSDVVMPPIWIVIQALQEKALTDSKWAAVAALVIDHEIDLHMIEVPDHPGIIETVKTEALKFWQLVLSGREPDPDYARDGELIRAMLKQDDGSEIDLTANNELPDLVERRQEAMRLAKAFDTEATGINARLLHMLGNAAIGRYNGGYISAKTVKRPAYQVKATAYRQLRVVRFNQKNGGAEDGAD